MKQKIIIFIFILSCSFSKAQTKDSIHIYGQFIGNRTFARIVVKKFGMGSFPIVSKPIVDEKFLITVPIDVEAGVYRFQFGQNEPEQFIDLIIDGKEKVISFTLDLLATEVFPTFSVSDLNRNWYEYQKKTAVNLQKTVLLEQFLYQYPSPKDNIVYNSKKTLAKEKEIFKKAFTLFIKSNANNFAGEMVRNRPHYFTNPTEDFRLQDYELRNHFWDNIDTQNPALLNTPLHTEHILNYLKYYMNPEMHFSESEMDAGFIKSVDTIVKKYSGNETMKKFAIKYLQMGFKEMGKENVLKFIDQKYGSSLILETNCEDGDYEKSELEERLLGYATLKPGNPAPNIVWQDKYGINKNLGDIVSDTTIVVFWSSTCPHCNIVLPKINEWASLHANYKVLAISLDDNKEEYKKAVEPLPNLIHSCEYKKFESKAALDYFIVATPTFIVLNNEKIIINKFSSWETTESSLK